MSVDGEESVTDTSVSSFLHPEPQSADLWSIVAAGQPRSSPYPDVASDPVIASRRETRCPLCRAAVLVAETPPPPVGVPRAPGVPAPTSAAAGIAAPRRLLLEPTPPEEALPAAGCAFVVISPAGRAVAVRPLQFRLHHCSPQNAAMSATGAYTVDVITRPCPVEFCLASPGEMCTSMRGEVLVRPHGVRAVPPDAPDPAGG